MGSSRGSKQTKNNYCVKNYNPVPIKTTHLNEAPSSFLDKNKSEKLNNFKQQELSNDVTVEIIDDSSDSDTESEDDLSIEEEDPSIADQKVTAVIAVIDTATEDPTSGHEHSKRCRRSNKLLFTKKIRVLLDTGSDGDIWFHRKGATKRFPKTERQMVKSYHTSAGVFQTKEQAKFDMKFFEYSESKIYTIRPDIVEYDRMERPAFDLILGVQTLKRLEIVLDFRTNIIEIDNVSLPMRDINKLQERSKIDRAWAVNNSLRLDEPKSTEELTDRTVKILDAVYTKADLPSVVENNCSHLSLHQRTQLLKLLTEFEDLFDGTLGEWDTDPVSLELKPDVKPYAGKPYPVPRSHRDTLIKEVQRLCDLGVLKWQPESEWASQSFIIAKKDRTVRFLSDFREVNKRIIRNPFPIPKISTVLQEMEGFTFATALDLNMGYYTIRLDPDAQKICTIIFPWGKYSYQRLPMGIAGSPDIFQAKMSELMISLEYVRAYIDDILCITNESFEDHLEKLSEVLKRLQGAGLKVNARKSYFCAEETEYLGYVLTRDGIKPQRKKIEAILALKPPTKVKELRSFLGMVQYYRDLWAKRSEMLAPLSDLVAECGYTKLEKARGKKKVPWHWDEVHQRAFDNAKAAIAKDVALAYPDFSKEFEIYTDGSAHQIGAVITQGNRPLAFFSRKLTKCQKKYSVTEIELLAIVETLKEFKGILWGQKIKVYTDHKNLMQKALGMTSDRVYRWRLLLEEFGPEIVWIKGQHNTVADAISRLDYAPTEEHKHNWMTVTQCWNQISKKLPAVHPEYEASMNFVFAQTHEEDSIYPLTVSEIAEAQKEDTSLLALAKSDRYKSQLVENISVLCKDGKMVIPKNLNRRAVEWYHHYLQHPGSTRLEETLRGSMYWKGMRSTVRAYVKNCKKCQVNKKRQKQYGKLPTKQVITKPWHTLCVDLIGPYTIKGKDKTEIDFMCLTMIDPATSWFEIVELPVVQRSAATIAKDTKSQKGKRKTPEKEPYFDKSSAMISNLVNKTWFCRYPRCSNVIYDNGSEFKLHFQSLCDTYGLKRKPTTVKNPQANAILERIHQTLAAMMRTAELDMAMSVDPSDIEDFLTNAAWAVRSTYHTVLKASPGAAIFGRDMLFDIPFIADWTKIGDYRQSQTDRNTTRENKSRVGWDYKVGDKVLVRKEGILRKSESKYLKDPWTITQVHTNGTIRIQCGTKSERLNIRRVTPFFEE